MAAVVASAGLVPRLAAELIVAIQCDVRHVYSVSASFCQIYNEQARHAKVREALPGSTLSSVVAHNCCRLMTCCV